MVAVVNGESQLGRLTAFIASVFRPSVAALLPLFEVELGGAYVFVIVIRIEPGVSLEVDFRVDARGLIRATLAGHDEVGRQKEHFTAKPASLLIALRTLGSTIKRQEKEGGC